MGQDLLVRAIGEIALQISNGAFIRSVVHEKYPNLPPQIGCAVSYWSFIGQPASFYEAMRNKYRASLSANTTAKEFPQKTFIPPSPTPPASVAQFERYPATDIYSRPVRMPDFQGRDRNAKDYRTRIRNGIKEGPNFAGRYKVIQIGCGTGCTFVYVADVSTGRVLGFPHGGEYDQELELEYRFSSNLIRAWWIPPEYTTDYRLCMREDMLLKDDRFVSLDRSGTEKCPGYCDNGLCKPFWSLNDPDMATHRLLSILWFYRV
jgi:hypothetical protein